MDRCVSVTSIFFWLDEILPRPFIHLSELIFSRSDLNTRFDAVGSQRTSAVDIPLLVDRLLDGRVSANKVVKRLDVRLSPEHGEGQVVVLEVEADTGKVDQWLDSCSTKLLGVTCMLCECLPLETMTEFEHTDARALQNQRRTKSASTNNDLLSCLVDLGLILPRREWLSRNNLDADSSTSFHDHFLNLGVADQVQVRVVSTGAVDVCMSRV